MNLGAVRKREMFDRLSRFGVEYASYFPPGSLGARLFAQLTAAIVALSQFGASQVSSDGASAEGSTSKALTRDALKEQMDKISYTAKAIAVDTPGIDDKFRVPRGAGDQRLLNAARAFALDAEPLADTFVEHGLPASFLAGLKSAITDFEEAIHDHSHGKDSRIASRAGLEAALESGFDAVRKLDAVVRNTIADPPIVAFWQAARHVDRLRRRNQEAAPTTAPAPVSMPCPDPSVHESV